MDLLFISQHIGDYISAALLVLRTGLIGIALSLAIGIMISIIRFWKVPILSPVLSFYVSFGRNTPLLLQLFFIYFGLPKAGVVIPAEICAIIGLSFLGSAYMAEALRSGLESVEKIQHDTALSIGMTKFQSMRHIILPQAFSSALPGICANVIFLIKETSVFSAIALADFLYVAKELIGIYYKTEEALLMLVISYTILLAPLSIAAYLLERRNRHGSNVA